MVITEQQQAILDHWNSYFVSLREATNNPKILPPPIGTGIYGFWLLLYLQGKQLGPATSFEYDSVNWEGVPIRCQNFGSYRIEVLINAYGPVKV